MKKWQVIDLVRSFSIIAVMGVHNYANIPFQHAWTCWLWGRFCLNGFYGVLLFLMVSGFLITHVIAKNPGGLAKPNLRLFYVQRIGRIWPLFLLVCGFGGLLYLLGSPNGPRYREWFQPGPYYGPWFWLSIPTFLFNWFLVAFNDWGYAGQWNILWSLSIEEQFYLFYPLCLKKIARKTRGWMVALGVILFAMAWRLFFYFHWTGNHFIQSYGTPAKLDMIAMGILLYWTVQHHGKALSRAGALSACLCVAGGLLLLASYFGTRWNDPLEEIYAPELLGLGLFLFLLGGLHLSFFESALLRPLSLPGKYCYGGYLLHLPLKSLLDPFLGRFDVFSRFGICILATTLVAASSYHFFEMPLNRAIRRHFGGKTAPRTR
ncbi:MAG TPA: acyltransferase [bacterium]|nr:acyltransferase [bacterium]